MYMCKKINVFGIFVLILMLFIITAENSSADEKATTVLSLSKIEGAIVLELKKGMLDMKRGGSVMPKGSDKPAKIVFLKNSIDDEIDFRQGMLVQVGKGGITLKGIFYPEGTRLLVDKNGQSDKYPAGESLPSNRGSRKVVEFGNPVFTHGGDINTGTLIGFSSFWQLTSKDAGKPLDNNSMDVFLKVRPRASVLTGPEGYDGPPGEFLFTMPAAQVDWIPKVEFVMPRGSKGEVSYFDGSGSIFTLGSMAYGHEKLAEPDNNTEPPPLTAAQKIEAGLQQEINEAHPTVANVFQFTSGGPLPPGVKVDGDRYVATASGKTYWHRKLKEGTVGMAGASKMTGAYVDFRRIRNREISRALGTGALFAYSAPAGETIVLSDTSNKVLAGKNLPGVERSKDGQGFMAQLFVTDSGINNTNGIFVSYGLTPMLGRSDVLISDGTVINLKDADGYSVSAFDAKKR
jgi:hypothetical protein